MGKVVGLIGAASGKIGNLVYAITNGIQTARVYQPNVANPKSTGQNLQRAKANLVGRLSAITPRSAIVGLGNNNRQRRSEYLKNGLLKATATIESGVYAAKLQPGDVIFSKGSVNPVITVSTITVSSVGVTLITYNRNAQVTTDEWNAAAGSWIVVAIDSATGNYDFVRVFNWNKPVNPPSSETQVVQELDVEQSANHELFLYFVPYVINPEKASTITGGIAVDASAYVAELGLTEAAASLEFGKSKYVGEATPI